MPASNPNSDKSFTGDDDLYRAVIMDHYARPRNKEKIEDPTIVEEGFNPSCGDEVELYLQVDNGVIIKVGHQGQGCSISQASVSMMAELIEGKSIDEVAALSECFKGRMTTREELTEPAVDIGDLEALDGVRFYPVRIKCALLCWETLNVALDKAQAKD